jgi:6-phosphogluconolactonase (cycloisomerase 2 family)
MYVANQNSHTVTVLRIDPETGSPRPTGARIDVPSPACVLIRRT